MKFIDIELCYLLKVAFVGPYSSMKSKDNESVTNVWIV